MEQDLNGLKVLTSSSSTAPLGIGSGVAGVAGTVALMAHVAYPIAVEYRRYVAPGRLQLQWQHRSLVSPSADNKMPIPSSRLLAWTTPASMCGSLRTLVVNAAHACAGQSTLTGSLLSLATAGISAALMITSRDEFNNLRNGPDGGIGGSGTAGGGTGGSCAAEAAGGSRPGMGGARRWALVGALQLAGLAAYFAAADTLGCA